MSKRPILNKEGKIRRKGEERKTNVEEYFRPAEIKFGKWRKKANTGREDFRPNTFVTYDTECTREYSETESPAASQC